MCLRKLGSFILLLSLILPFSSQAQTDSWLQQHVVISHPQLLQVLDRAKSTSARLSIENQTGKSLIINHAECEGFEKVMIHKTSFKNGVQKMEEIPQLMIADGKRQRLTANGIHLMFMQPKRTFNIGEFLKMVVQTNQGTFFVLLEVVPHKIR